MLSWHFRNFWTLLGGQNIKCIINLPLISGGGHRIWDYCILQNAWGSKMCYAICEKYVIKWISLWKKIIIFSIFQKPLTKKIFERLTMPLDQKKSSKHSQCISAKKLFFLKTHYASRKKLWDVYFPKNGHFRGVFKLNCWRNSLFV